MKILAIDTVTESCSVAILDGDAEFQRCEIQAAGHSKLILKMVEEALAESENELGDMDVIAVDTGPGSFAGVRIGLGVAQGLAYGTDLSVIGICSLEVMAASVNSRIVVPAIDARMNQIYCGMYEAKENARPLVLHESVVVNPNAIPFDVNQDYYGLGSGWDTYSSDIKNCLGKRNVEIISGYYPEAKFLARIAQYAGLDSAVNPMVLQATYVRNDVAQPSIKTL